MNHDEIKDLIGPFIDKELNIEDSYRVREHLKVCTECQKYYEELKSLEGKIKKVVESESIPSDAYFKSLSSAVMAQLPRKTESRFGAVLSFFSRREMKAVGVMGFVLVFAVLFQLLFVDNYRKIQRLNQTITEKPEEIPASPSSYSTSQTFAGGSPEERFAISSLSTGDSIKDVQQEGLIEHSSGEIQVADISTTDNRDYDELNLEKSTVGFFGGIQDRGEIQTITLDGTEEELSLSLTRSVHDSQETGSTDATIAGSAFYPAETAGCAIVSEEISETDDSLLKEFKTPVKIRFDIDSGGLIYRIQMPEDLDTAIKSYVLNKNYLRRSNFHDTTIILEIPSEKIIEFDFNF
ncbi:zf-HC2 domain-containing protein [candidate division WOR-3 bacterium]|nr:zf-HC2 domain-containing protein [candidate division WOR-3 bacterium]